VHPVAAVGARHCRRRARDYERPKSDEPDWADPEASLSKGPGGGGCAVSEHVISNSLEPLLADEDVWEIMTPLGRRSCQ
jgi:hypothetical protein